MKMVKVKIEGQAPLSMSRYIQVEKLPKELARDYEIRCWRERIHQDKNGFVVIPPMMLVKSIQAAAGFMGLQIPGRGKERYTKHFKAGIRCNEVMALPIKVDEVPGDWLLVPSDGKTGGTTRVEKCFPVIDEWGGVVTMYITDDIITQEVFQDHINTAGQLVGIGRFRPERGGFYGCFKAEVLEWKEM